MSGSVDFESGVLIGRKPQKYPIDNTVAKEFKTVKRINVNARHYVKEMLDSVRVGRSIDTNSARSLVEESVESVIRHPDAIAFAARLRGEDEYTAEHCMNVCMLAIVFGRKLGLRKNQLVNLGFVWLASRRR